MCTLELLMCCLHLMLLFAMQCCWNPRAADQAQIVLCRRTLTSAVQEAACWNLLQPHAAHSRNP
jgi:hypothetical protein